MLTTKWPVRLAQMFLVLLGLPCAAPGLASCPTTNQYSFSFGSATAATLAYGTTYTYTATNGNSQSQTFTMKTTANGLSVSTLNTGTANVQLPAINNLITDGTVTNNLVIGGTFAARTASIKGTTNLLSTVITFATAIRDFTVQVNDIDYTNNQYRDWLYITGSNGASSYVPTITTPFGSNNTGGATTATNSTLALGPASTPYTGETANEGIGTANNPNNANGGTVTASFAQPVTSITINYGNYPLQTGETVTGQQAYGIQSISFCPVPSVTMTKTSAPFITDTTNPLSHNVPGADIIYTLTVTNSNSSPVDASTLVLTDPLPSTVTFYNGDIDGTGPLTTNYNFSAGSSGLTFSSANLTYSNNGGTSYAYTPATGYDTAVNAIRLAPQGTMAANSSFSLQFRVRIK